jgi:hypothetical protein
MNTQLEKNSAVVNSIEAATQADLIRSFKGKENIPAKLMKLFDRLPKE